MDEASVGFLLHRFPNLIVEADGALLDGNVPATVGRPCCERGHLWTLVRVYSEGRYHV